jgi:uncharacterized membrane protein YgcG
MGADWVYSMMSKDEEQKSGERAHGKSPNTPSTPFRGGGGQSGGGGASGSW